MLYSCFAMLGVVVLIIVNFDVIVKNSFWKSVESIRPYRSYLMGIVFFFITDILWGVLYEHQLIFLCYVDTVLYFMAMVNAIFLWTRYVIFYLQSDNAFGIVLKFFGWFLMCAEIVCLIINLFVPVMFSFDSDGIFETHILRYITLFGQVLLYFLTSAYSLIMAIYSAETMRHRYRSIGFAGIIVSAFLLLQANVPLMPFSSIGYMLGSTLLHTFVLEDEKLEQNKRLQKMLDREMQQREELERARKMAYVDSLTGVRNKHAYFEVEKSFDERITNRSVQEFGVIVLDMNNLKDVNDRLGHEAGDRYIKEGCRHICMTFQHSPVFRVGGDEFVVILEGQDYQNRLNLLGVFNSIMEQNNKTGAVVVAAGLEDYQPDIDYCYQCVFKRADKKMYDRKQSLKKMKL
ncbi:MAG: GGDEF domain-containing protein [Lachnospiraceae bacterium]|nr:GGDEF domain-containing protein [Lachnospiraceae bacterium]